MVSISQDTPLGQDRTGKSRNYSQKEEIMQELRDMREDPKWIDYGRKRPKDVLAYEDALIFLTRFESTEELTSSMIAMSPEVRAAHGPHLDRILERMREAKIIQADDSYRPVILKRIPDVYNPPHLQIIDADERHRNGAHTPRKRYASDSAERPHARKKDSAESPPDTTPNTQIDSADTTPGTPLTREGATGPVSGTGPDPGCSIATEPESGPVRSGPAREEVLWIDSEGCPHPVRMTGQLSVTERLFAINMEKVTERVKEYGEGVFAQALDWLEYGTNIHNAGAWVFTYVKKGKNSVVTQKMINARAKAAQQAMNVPNVAQGGKKEEKSVPLANEVNGKRPNDKSSPADPGLVLQDPTPEEVHAWRLHINSLMGGEEEKSA
jgi:hypothetical protein